MDWLGIKQTAYRWVLRVNRAYYTRLFTLPYNTDGVDVVAEDWDTLVVLDACRLDSFPSSEFPGHLETRQSRGSMTIEFLEANFEERTLHDTVYVTATSQIYNFADELGVEFHDVINVWMEETNLRSTLDGGSVVPPETMTAAAVEAAEMYPNKRLIIHYLQPHIPFLEPAAPGITTDAYDLARVGAGEASGDDVRESYQNNVNRIVAPVKRLLETLKGRTVVTADHGEMLGERGFPIPIPVWGHPHSIYTDELVKVPWLVHGSGSRRRIVSEPPEGTNESIDEDAIQRNLRDLGYVTD